VRGDRAQADRASRSGFLDHGRDVLGLGSSAIRSPPGGTTGRLRGASPSLLASAPATAASPLCALAPDMRQLDAWAYSRGYLGAKEGAARMRRTVMVTSLREPRPGEAQL
jgi:hypothetical protein